MPEFDLACLSAPVPLAHAHVQSVMLFPHDAQARRRAQDAFVAKIVAEGLPLLSSAGISVDAALASWLYEAPRLTEVLGSRGMLGIVKTAVLMGTTFGFVLQAEHYHPELASVGAILRGVSQRLRSRKGASYETLKKAWSQYSCVAHLWLTMISAEGFLNYCEEDHEMLLLFLATAEEERRRGEACIPRQACKPVLDPAKTWKVPSNLRLPRAVTVHLLPPHPDDLQMASRGKRQRQQW